MTIEDRSRKLDVVLSQTSELIMVGLQKSMRDCFEGPLFEDLRESLVDEWESSVPVRGYLVRVGYEVGGGKFAQTTAVATAIELAQLATLILDDVIDRSDIRTGFSTYRTYGEGVSLVVSEMLKTAATKTLAETLRRNPQFANRFAVLERFERMYARVCLGQVLDLMYERSGLDFRGAVLEDGVMWYRRLSRGSCADRLPSLGSTRICDYGDVQICAFTRICAADL
jgi:geranylgeranyl pyrophosphate synthase